MAAGDQSHCGWAAEMDQSGPFQLQKQHRDASPMKYGGKGRTGQHSTQWMTSELSPTALSTFTAKVEQWNQATIKWEEL